MASAAAKVGKSATQLCSVGTKLPCSGKQTRPCAAHVSRQLPPYPDENHCTGGSSEARRPHRATCAVGHKQACTVEKMCAKSGSHAKAEPTDRAVTTPLSSSWHTTSTVSGLPAAASCDTTVASMGMVSPGATLPYSSVNAWQLVRLVITSDVSNGSDKAHAKLVAKSAAGILGLGGGGGARGAIRSSEVTMHCVAWSWIWWPVQKAWASACVSKPRHELNAHGVKGGAPGGGECGGGGGWAGAPAGTPGGSCGGGGVGGGGEGGVEGGGAGGGDGGGGDGGGTAGGVDGA